MSIDRIDHPWAESGSLETTLTDDKRDIGWVAGDSPDQPTVERFNLLQNETDNKINEAIEVGVGSGAEKTPYYLGLFEHGSSPMLPDDESNTIAQGSSAGGSLNDLVYTTKDGKNIILAVRGDTRLVLYDIDNMVWLEDVEESTLGSIGDEIYSACSDGTYAYVLWADTTASPDDYFVQAYDMSTWSIKAGWPAGGVELTAHGTTFTSFQAKIRMATSEKLVVTQPWVVLSSGTSAAVSILSTDDGTIDGTGAGDCGSLSSGQIFGACSNGTYVFLAIDNGTDLILSSMSIASPGSTGCSWSWTPSSYTTGIASTYFGGIACCGNMIVMTFNDNTNLATIYTTAQGRTAHFQTSDADVIEKLGPVCSDGLNFWALGTRERQGATDDILMLYKFETHGTGYYSTGASTYETYTNGDEYFHGFKSMPTLPDGFADFSDNPISSDGDAIWFCPSTDASGTGASVYRLRRSLFR